LLKLLPSDSGELLNAELLIYCLDEAPDYTALSYCWGDPATEQITVDGKPKHITRNLMQALKAVSQK
jgi:Heterokaryon incompatibility protein (HET)